MRCRSEQQEQSGTERGHYKLVNLMKALGKTSAAEEGNLLGETGRTTPSALAVDSRVLTDSHGSVGADVVLVGTVLTALGSDALQLLLRRRVGIADLHHEALFADGNAVESLDDLLADVTRLETLMTDQSSDHSDRVRD